MYICICIHTHVMSHIDAQSMSSFAVKIYNVFCHTNNRISTCWAEAIRSDFIFIIFQNDMAEYNVW